MGMAYTHGLLDRETPAASTIMWTSPHGPSSRIDCVAVPLAWAGGVVTAGAGTRIVVIWGHAARSAPATAQPSWPPRSPKRASAAQCMVPESRQEQPNVRASLRRPPKAHLAAPLRSARLAAPGFT